MAALGPTLRVDEDERVFWEAANTVTANLAVGSRSKVMTPLRHALTGRKVRGLCGRG